MRRLGLAIELLLRRGGIRGGCWVLALGLPACGLLLLLALQACVTVLAAMIVVVNLLIDIGYGMIDPRVRNQ
jgi:hypothetical protein